MRLAKHSWTIRRAVQPAAFATVRFAPASPPRHEVVPFRSFYEALPSVMNRVGNSRLSLFLTNFKLIISMLLDSLHTSLTSSPH